MLKKGLLLSIIFLLIFSVCGYAFDYTYTQQSGAGYFVGTADKSDALEDCNELRTIVNDLGALLEHSKMDGLYPKDLTTGGTIQIPEVGLKFSNDPVDDGIAAYIAGEMKWQTKAELGLDLSLYYLKTEIDTLSEIENIYSKNITDSDELASALTDYYLKTSIDTIGEVEAIYVVDIIDGDELAALKFTDLADTPANYTDQAGKYVKVNAGATALEFGTPTGGAGTYLELTDTPETYDNGKYAKSTVDGVVWDDPAGVGDMLKTTYDIDTNDIVDKAETVDDGAGNISTAADVKDAVTKKHTQNTDTAAGGEWDFGAHSAGFTVQTITSPAGTATINWGNSNKARITLSENTTLAFTNPANSGNYLLIIIQPAGSNAYTTTFPAGIYWANSTKVNVPTADNNRCIVSFVFDDEDGDKWYCQGTETFATDD